MTLGIRKMFVLGLVGCVFVLANALFIAHWMNEIGVTGWASFIRKEFLTGTAITIIIVLLILLVPARAATQASAWVRRCPVCDHLLVTRGRYCPECGSSVSKAAG